MFTYEMVTDESTDHTMKEYGFASRESTRHFYTASVVMYNSSCPPLSMDESLAASRYAIEHFKKSIEIEPNDSAMFLCGYLLEDKKLGTTPEEFIAFIKMCYEKSTRYKGVFAFVIKEYEGGNGLLQQGTQT